jgi:hypothetical protein
MMNFVEFYNSEVDRYIDAKKLDDSIFVGDFVSK